MYFDIARPRISMRRTMYLACAVPVGAGVVAALVGYGGKRSVADLILLVLVLVLGCVLVGELILRACLWFGRRADAKRLGKARAVRPDAILAVFAHAPRFGLVRGGGFGALGILTLANSGVTYQPGMRQRLDPTFVIGWEDVETVEFRPLVIGKLRLGLRGNRAVSWWIRGDGDAVFDALACIRDAS